MKNKKLILSLGIFLLVVLAAQTGMAQCPMCRMTLESNLKNGGQAGQGMNSGIFYLLFTPYIMVGAVAYMWWRNKKKRLDSEHADDLVLEE